MSASPVSSLHDLLKILGGLASGAGGSGSSGVNGSLYITWDGPFLDSGGSMPGDRLSDLTRLLPQPGSLDVLSREAAQVLHFERQETGGISLQSLIAPFHLGPLNLIGDWPSMETLMWVPRLPQGAAEAIATYLQGPGCEPLLHLPASAGIAVLLDGHVKHRVMVQRFFGDHRLVAENNSISHWLAGSGAVAPSPEGVAAPFNTTFAVQWTVPLSGNGVDEPGTLGSWQASETQPSPLRGILRGPWNLATSLAEDPWNLHLQGEAATLILEMLRKAAPPDDPALALDLLPGDETHPFTAALLRKAESAPLVPDATGTLRLGRQLWNHPCADLRIAQTWQELAAPMAHRRVVHPSCLTGKRPKVLALLSRQFTGSETFSPVDSPSLRPWDFASWFDALLPAGPEVARRMLDLARQCREAVGATEWAAIRSQLKIIRTDGEQLHSADEVYFPQVGGFIPEDRFAIHSDLLDDPEARGILTEVLGVIPPQGLPAKLVSALGENAKELLTSALSQHVPSTTLHPLDAESLAEIALGVHGSSVLSKLRQKLEEAGHRPPGQWGGHSARTFVHSLGFPEAFAVAGTATRPSEEFLMGPEELPPLHDFQQEVFDAVRGLVDTPANERRRAVISLPTGGGKTRVTVQTAVDLILKPVTLQCQMLWVAQSDELCEQAVQAFRQVWAQRGRSRTELRIVRLWGGNQEAPPPERFEPVVVVASIQTLLNRMALPDLAWLRRCGLLVIDECHHAIAPSYTKVLKWIDEAPSSPAASSPIILGLSATPFRNAQEESLRLAERFERRLFPPGQQDLYQRLLDRGVLAKAVYRFIESGRTIGLEDLEAMQGMPENPNPIEFENRVRSINRKLASDEERNAMIVEEIRNCDQRSILLFANSPAHSRKLAAMLIAKGVTAAAIDAETPRSARRWLLDRFQSHEIRVLCNHSVLTTGFDAPKVDMIFISRQVFSPVLYMQMVGRGLRGPLNGGTPDCQIVTVRDNWLNYGDRLAWHYWEEFFQQPA